MIITAYILANLYFSVKQEIGTEIITLLHKIQEVSKDYADIKDIFFDDNSVEFVEDSVSVFKFLNNSRKALALIKFKYFLRGLNYNNTDKESINKLIDYVDNKEKAEFITNSLDKSKYFKFQVVLLHNRINIK